MFTSTTFRDLMRRTLAITAVLGASAAVMSAQVSAGSASAADTTVATPAISASALPQLDLNSPLLHVAAQEPLSSSSSSENELALNTNQFHFENAMQYGGGRRYGRPRYRGSNSNADGSKKYDFYVGAGFTVPTGNTHRTNTTSWGFQVGGGRNFNKHVGMNLEFDWDNFGLQSSTLNNQQNLYNEYIDLYNDQFVDGANDPNAIPPISGLDGYSHVWSLSLQPVYNIRSGEGLGAYVTGGVGFYHKITTFTEPGVGEYCDPYYGICYEYQANQPIDSYTSNAPGFDGGIGFTYKFSHFSSERLYGEIRYVYMLNQYKPGVDASTTAGTNANAALYNDYPQNSERTSYIPVKFGIRF